MNARHIALIVTVIASTGALLSTSQHHELAQHQDHHQTILHSHNHNAFDHHDDVAVDDMLQHAAMHFGGVSAIPETYVALPQWKPSWELRWMDFQHGDHVVRLYHATDHQHPDNRYLIAVDDTEHDPADHWTPAQ